MHQSHFTTIAGTFPVLSCAGAAAFEKTFFANPANDEAVFMARAARGIADEAESFFSEIRARPIRSVAVLAGKGHNAADALLAAGLLQKRHEGAVVKVLLAQSPEKMSPVAARALCALLAAGAQAYAWRGGSGGAGGFAADGADVLLDGLLGYNFHPPLCGAFSGIIHWANACAEKFKLRIAVDLPSGMGDVPADGGGVVFHADATIACGIVKAPLLDIRNAAARGRLRFADIGFPDAEPGVLRAGARALVTAGPLGGLRAPLADKRDFGHLFILGGSRALPGALLMNVRAALRAGVGLLTVFCPESVHAAFAAAAPEAMWVAWPETPEGALALEGEHLLRERLHRATALLCGSGMGTGGETQALLRSVSARAACPLVLDADALRAEVLESALLRPAGAPLVLLPHAGEFARIAAAGESLRDACTRLEACVALKGAPTHVADGGREIVVCAGGPVLARGGSGDLLAGITGALFARRLCGDALQTLATAVAWHGLAADRVACRRGSEAVATTELVDGLGPVLRGE
ncbi:MAG: NAD(P)H-hydrate dehydratase [Puniceicoccales bacterium]|jgi:NAD(P)H-hydrate epimerase|nr:NAD(P)H-hydrate dehydratase [Puniceicoccales bacterium]